MFARLERFYRAQIRALTHGQPFLLLLIRGYWGYQFMLTGRGKLLNIERTTEFFASLNIPLPMLNAYLAGTTELIGGLCLLVGLASRFSTLPLIGTMLGAYATAHVNELTSIVSNPDLFVSAPPFMFLLASTIVLAFGPGWISLDGLMQKYLWKNCHACDPKRTHAMPTVLGNSMS